MNYVNNLWFPNEYLEEAKQYNGYILGRVIAQYKNYYKVLTQNTEVAAEISGKFHFNANKLSDYPAVGDYVMVDRESNQSGNAIIHSLLTRKSMFSRKAVGTSNEVQLVATNIDTIFICMSLNRDFNLRRLERYLSIAWDSGAMPVIILTKADLCENIATKLDVVESVAYGVDVLVTTNKSDNAYSSINDYIAKGKTATFIGSSGVGKSTLINGIFGEIKVGTNEIRDDDKGRHTTTRRELFVLPNGGAVIDTPGMREIGVEYADFSKSFSDIEDLIGKCKFSDCTHKSEPNCAVQKAMEKGILSIERFENYLKLKKEAKYDGLSSKQIEYEKINKMFGSMSGMKNARKQMKEKNAKKT